MKKTIARMAAVTSLTIPSVSSAAATRSRTGTTSRIGVTTVGPVATSNAPMVSARFHGTSKAYLTTAAVPASAITAPTVTRRIAAWGASLIRSILRWNAPSKTMMATAMPTMVWRPLPNVSAVSISSPGSPSTRPAAI